MTPPASRSSRRCAIVLSPTRARVAQWIRAFASGAKGRRFDPCRGYQLPQFSLHIIMSPALQNPNEQPRTILVVDDFEDTRLLLRTWLRKKGYRVVEAENGNEAIAKARDLKPDLIIMDVEMPELDGLSATREIRTLKNSVELPIVAVSAYGADLFREQALAAGCNDYMSTPFEPDE